MTEAEKFLLVLGSCLAVWLCSFELPPIPQLRRPYREPRQAHVKKVKP